MSLMNWYRVPKLAGSASLAITSAQPSYSGPTSPLACSRCHIADQPHATLDPETPRTPPGHEMTSTVTHRSPDMGPLPAPPGSRKNGRLATQWNRLWSTET